MTPLSGHHVYCNKKLMEILKRVAPNPQGVRVMDLGCGAGQITGRLHQAGYDVIGVEPSRSVYDARLAFPHVTFVEGSCNDDLVSKYGKFDIIVSIEVIEHLFTPRILLENAYAALKPGGRLILSTPYHGYLKNVALAVAGKWDHHHDALIEDGHVKFFSRATLEELIVRSGLRSAEFYRVGRIPPVAKTMFSVAEKPLQHA